MNLAARTACSRERRRRPRSAAADRHPAVADHARRASPAPRPAPRAISDRRHDQRQPGSTIARTTRAAAGDPLEQHPGVQRGHQQQARPRAAPRSPARRRRSRRRSAAVTATIARTAGSPAGTRGGAGSRRLAPTPAAAPREHEQRTPRRRRRCPRRGTGRRAGLDGAAPVSPASSAPSAAPASGSASRRDAEELVAQRQALAHRRARVRSTATRPGGTSSATASSAITQPRQHACRRRGRSCRCGPAGAAPASSASTRSLTACDVRAKRSASGDESLDARGSSPIVIGRDARGR